MHFLLLRKWKQQFDHSANFKRSSSAIYQIQSNHRRNGNLKLEIPEENQNLRGRNELMELTLLAKAAVLEAVI